MRKILIFGNSGSGKSTLAKALCRSDGLSHLDLDTLAWESSVPPKRKSLDGSGKAIQHFIQSHIGWVIEGCYTDLLEMVLPHSTEIIFMNLPIETCMNNAKQRPWEPHKYESKAVQDANLDMLIEWISQYSKRTDTFSEQSHRVLYEGFQGKKAMRVSNEINV
ncbi:shikimate kinase [Shewanella surugensis]|uniref:Shikimate kinase n=1 Tax=Shewanella surugensis TaxID=212020 RepID=A0ABT0LB97_9GAMM|nr:shikimate kinase [Shewanella surugensis]MCL1124982.1 shikimate kinase [Shewanella surugensis]